MGSPAAMLINEWMPDRVRHDGWKAELVVLEIEAKFRVESLEDVAARLREVGGEDCGQVVQRDRFFDDGDGSLLAAGSGLRIRVERSDVGEKIILTFKGKKQASKFKSRPEMEVEVGEFAAMKELLGGLGYEEILVFEKRRELWIVDSCLVCLDEVPRLGRFVEVEGPSEEIIAGVVEKLGLGGLEHVKNGYARMMRDELGDSEKLEVLFEN